MMPLEAIDPMEALVLMRLGLAQPWSMDALDAMPEARLEELVATQQALLEYEAAARD